MIKKASRGFTLIELLVVIAVIGILAAVIMASLNSARVKARDAKRVADLKQIQTALTLFYNDKGYYPGDNLAEMYYFTYYPYTTVGDCGYVNSASPDGVWCDLEQLLSPYLSSLPRDTSLLSRYIYKYSIPTKTYALYVKLENANTASQNDGGVYPDAFEVGELPAYCMNKYAGGWTLWSSASACNAGN